MTNWISSFGSLFWLPIVLWLSLFAWSRFLDYPELLNRRIRAGKTWCYVPEWWSKMPGLRLVVRAVRYILGFFAAFSTAATAFWIFPTPIYWVAILFVLLLILQSLWSDFAKKQVYRLELNAYFWEYKKQSDFYAKSGNVLSKEDLDGHTTWAFRSALKKAESEKHLFKHLREMARQELVAEKEAAAYEDA